MKTLKTGCQVLALGLALAMGAAALADGANLDVARQLNQAFVDVARKVSPSVVVINVVQKTTVVSDEDQDGAFDAVPPGFWRRFHQQFNRPETVRSLGSGIIIRANGYILTNRHVVEDAESVEVRLLDGRTFKATVRGTDPQSDLAVLRIDAQELPACQFADSAKTQVGEFAIAIGAPFSLDYTVTFGHVSAKDRSNVLDGLEAPMMDQDFIQTDALINPGNSGGPLVNLEGEVIGVNTLIRGLNTGIGFAIPSNLAREVTDQLIAEGKFVRAWLGISITGLREMPELRDLIHGIDDGVVVSRIMPDGPAAKSDLKPSDVITAVDSQKVSTPQQLRTAIRGKKIGHPLTLDVYRKGKFLKVEVSPGEWIQPESTLAKAPAAKTPDTTPANLGLTVQALTADLAARFGISSTEGVLVASVEKNSPAERKGLKAGDIITSINQETVTSPKQFRELVRQADLKKGVLVNLVSSNSPRFEILKAAE